VEFGVQFFPSVGPDRKSAEQYWGEALQLTRLAEQLGYANVRIVAADGTKGWPDDAPYDAILAAASGSHVPGSSCSWPRSPACW